MKLLVTGGAGLLGAAVAGRHLGGAHAVMIADAFGPDGDGRAVRGGRAAALKARGAEVRRLDLAEPQAIEDLLGEFRPDAVVNAARLAAAVPIAPLLDALRKAGGVEYLVHVSDADLYAPTLRPGEPAREDDPLDPAGDPRLAARLADEEAVRAGAIPFTIFRAFEVIAPDMPPGRLARDVADAVVHGREVPLSDHDPRDFLDAEDAARAVQLALARRPAGRTLNLGSGTATTIRQLADAIAAHARRSARFGPAPPPGRAPRMADPTLAWETLGFGPEMPLDRMAQALAAAARRPGATAPSAGASGLPAPREEPRPAPEVSRREIFGLFRRPFDPKK